jgi:hypothetical protein
MSLRTAPGAGGPTYAVGLAAALMFLVVAAAPRSARAAAPDRFPRYAPVRADAPPTIDGLLDDPVWSRAPKDPHFFSMRSKPYGDPTKEPTIVQVAYDDRNLYVAFTCAYSAAGPRDGSVPPDENTLFDGSERVGVLVDARDDRTNARSFTVGRTGGRGDSEIANNGATANRDWHGLWDAATSVHADDTWTAEIAIPWGTLGMPARDAAFQVGIDFLRVEPTSNEYSAWSPAPPAILIAPSFFGHLEGLADIHPGQRLFLQPYVAVLARGETAGGPAPRLRDFTGTDGSLSTYAGAYARYRPPGALSVDATFNPDFSTVTPDRAVTNLDRFELSYPEVRPFFAEDRPRFELGTPNAQLFYSRRVGLRTTPTGAYTEVPVLWGGKAVVRDRGTTVAAMNVGLAATHLSPSDNITAARLNQ